MSTPATVPPLPVQGDPPSPAVDVRALIERQLAMLGRLAEAGLNIALGIEQQALAGEGAQAIQVVQGDVALAYGRVARAVRLTISLQGRLVKDLQALDEVAARLQRGQESRAVHERQAAQATRKERVERIIERVIRAEAQDEADGDRLADEAYERLEDDDIYGDLLARPVSEIIALICQDLGLSPDWSRLGQEAWAQAEIESGAAAAPLAALRGPKAPAIRPPDDPLRDDPLAPDAASGAQLRPTSDPER